MENDNGGIKENDSGGLQMDNNSGGLHTENDIYVPQTKHDNGEL